MVDPEQWGRAESDEREVQVKQERVIKTSRVGRGVITRIVLAGRRLKMR